MNAQDGVQVLRGWKVRQIQVQPNEVQIERETDSNDSPGGERRTLRADWLIDASGRRRLLARELGLATSTRHPTRADWVWLRGARDLDALGSEEWRARYRHTARGLATCHFMEQDSWCWLIPLPDGRTSYGRVALEPGGLPELPQLFAGAKEVARGQATRLAHGSRRIFGTGWALIGDAAFATDPLYSPGLDYVVDQADQIVEWIRRDGEEELTEAFEAWQQQRFTVGMLLVQDQYPVLGDYDLFRVRQVLDVGSYYNLLSAWTHRDHLDPGWIRRFLRFAERGNADLLRLGQRFASLAAERSPQHNQGCWDLALPGPQLQAHFGDARRLAERLRFHQRLVEAVDTVLDDLPKLGPGEEPWIRSFFDGVQP
jgi:flavin-dependent dehydrogenase